MVPFRVGSRGLYQGEVSNVVFSAVEGGCFIVSCRRHAGKLGFVTVSAVPIEAVCVV